MGTVRFLGTFLSNPVDVPLGVISYVANQLNISDISIISKYLERENTQWEHKKIIKEKEGYQEFASQPNHWRLMRWLYERVWVSVESQSVLFDVITAQLVEKKILLPGVTVLARFISNVKERVETRLYIKLSKLASQAQIKKLESLISAINTSEKRQETLLEKWRKGANRYSSIALVNALQKVEEVSDWGIGTLNMLQLPSIKIKALAQIAFTVKAQALSRMPEKKRIAILLAFVYVLEIKAIDDALDILELLVKDLLSKSERQGKKERLRTLKDLDRAALKLSKVGQVLLDEKCDDQKVREQVWHLLTKKELADAIIQIENIARASSDNYYQELLGKWRSVRIFLPTLLRVIKFESNKAGKPILEALTFLQLIEGKRQPDMENAPVKFLSKKGLSRVKNKDDIIDRKAYTFSVLEELVAGLCCRDLFVNKSEHWNNRLCLKKMWGNL